MRDFYTKRSIGTPSASRALAWIRSRGARCRIALKRSVQYAEMCCGRGYEHCVHTVQRSRRHQNTEPPDRKLEVGSRTFWPPSETFKNPPSGERKAWWMSGNLKNPRGKKGLRSDSDKNYLCGKTPAVVVFPSRGRWWSRPLFSGRRGSFLPWKARLCLATHWIWFFKKLESCSYVSSKTMWEITSNIFYRNL